MQIAHSRVFKAAIIFLLLPASTFGQNTPTAKLVDEVSIQCSEEMMSRYDAFLIELSERTDATGLILLFGDKTAEGQNAGFFRWASEFYPSMRGLNGDRRIEYARGANIDGKAKVQFWLLPAGAERPEFIPFQPSTGVAETVRYDVAAGEFYRDKGKTYLYFDGYYELGCGFPPHYFGLGNQLRKDSKLTAYLVVYTRFGRGAKYAKRVERFALNELVQKTGVSRTRIRTIYGGNRNDPEVEFWLVPKDGTPPPIKPDTERAKN